jgi:23S rRNA (guanosine2251-2'-O)-methyltransferase
MKIKESVVVLDNIRSVHNVGSIFRTADALGVSKIYLCGCTPTPTDRFGRERQDLAKTALGAEKTIIWEYFKETSSLIAELKKNKFQIIAIEQDEKSEDCRKIKVKSKVALVLGNEVDGVSKDILKKSDSIAEIPMFGKKESLNVSVSFGIAGFCLLQR